MYIDSIKKSAQHSKIILLLASFLTTGFRQTKNSYTKKLKIYEKNHYFVFNLIVVHIVCI